MDAEQEKQRRLLIVLLWEASIISEGTASKMIGVDRLSFRALRDGFIDEAAAIFDKWQESQ